MPWITRGIRDGKLTTGWPARPDPYQEGFATTAVARQDAPDVDEEELRAVMDDCPTGAITVRDGRAVLDTGRCILCGRCVLARPDVFAWRRGGVPVAVDRDGLLTPRAPELTEVRTRLAAKVRAFGRSVHIRHVDAGSDGSDEWEIQALTNPVYDIHRLGVFFTASPRHADILLVTGIGTAGMAEPLRRTRAAMPDPVVVMAVGADAAGGGLMGRGTYTGGSGVDAVVDVDGWVPGSPASPFAVLEGILTALGRLPRRRGRA